MVLIQLLQIKVSLERHMFIALFAHMFSRKDPLFSIYIGDGSNYGVKAGKLTAHLVSCWLSTYCGQVEYFY